MEITMAELGVESVDVVLIINQNWKDISL